MSITAPGTSSILRQIAVLFTDIAHSSRFFELHGNIAGRKMLEDHLAVIVPLIRDRGGVVVKTMGDSTLSYFLDPAGAVKSAVGIQKRMLENSEGHNLHLRIAIHYGEGLIEEQDIFGEVVNTAAKLLPVVEPDRICVTEALKDIINECLPVEYEERVSEDNEKPAGGKTFIVKWKGDSNLLPVMRIVSLINPVPVLGKKVLGDKWPLFLNTLLSHLNESAGKTEVLETRLILSWHDDLTGALDTLLLLVSLLRSRIKEVTRHLPVQIVVHQASLGKDNADLLMSIPIVWENLHPGFIFLTKDAHDAWMKNPDRDKGFEFAAQAGGLYRLEIVDGESAKSGIPFPPSEIMMIGSRRECFYCGSHRHSPISCPSKSLHCPARALHRISYFPAEKLTAWFYKVFTNPETYDSRLAELKEADINTVSGGNEPLVAYHAFFDLMEVFQLRFLRRLSQGNETKWNSLLKSRPEQESAGGKLLLILDCIRVGQLDRAQTLLNEDENQGFRFCILNGFLHLEMENYYEALYQLERARETAHKNLERIYALFLIARIHEVLENYTEAEETLGKIPFLDPDCLEAQYRRVVLYAKMGLGERALIKLKNLIQEQPESWVCPFIDPQLLSIQESAGPLLLTLTQAAQSRAMEISETAAKSVAVINGWLQEDDEACKDIKTLAGRLEAVLSTKSYPAYVEAEIMALDIISRCRLLRANLRAKLEREISIYSTQIKSYEVYWNKYAFKGMFKEFPLLLQPARDKLNYALSAAKSDEAHIFRNAKKLTAEMSLYLKELIPVLHRMELMESVLRNLTRFGKKALLMEAAVAAVSIVLLPAALLGASHFYPGLNWDRLADIWPYQKTLLLIGGFGAPVLAATMTLKSMWKT
ncbi:MAG: adenylate/guanylate cyclase domain-containing protein [Pseudomonadota bacterium]